MPKDEPERIKVTPEMLDAGEAELRRHLSAEVYLGSGIGRELAEAVYRAMSIGDRAGPE